MIHKCQRRWGPTAAASKRANRFASTEECNTSCHGLDLPSYIISEWISTSFIYNFQRRISRKRSVRSNPYWFTEFCNSQCLSHTPLRPNELGDAFAARPGVRVRCFLPMIKRNTHARAHALARPHTHTPARATYQTFG